MNRILAAAAADAGYRASGLDQTGLSQKAGPVVSHLRITSDEVAATNRVGEGGADLLLAFDLLVAADAKSAGYADPERTTTIASTSKTPTGDMVFDGSTAYPDDRMLIERMRSRSRQVCTIDALAVAKEVLGSTTAANLLLVGMAYQNGSLPIPEVHLENAMRANGVAVQANIAAFRWGRAIAVDPDCVPIRQPTLRQVNQRVEATAVMKAGFAGATLRLAKIRAQNWSATRASA